jgi:hypothetical protein
MRSGPALQPASFSLESCLEVAPNKARRVAEKIVAGPKETDAKGGEGNSRVPAALLFYQHLGLEKVRLFHSQFKQHLKGVSYLHALRGPAGKNLQPFHHLVALADHELDRE